MQYTTKFDNSEYVDKMGKIFLANNNNNNNNNNRNYNWTVTFQDLAETIKSS